MVNPELIISIIALMVSIFSVVFIALPYKDSLKPKLRIEIKNISPFFDSNKNRVQSILEWGNLNLVITNISDNTAKKIKIKLISQIIIKGAKEKRTIEDNDKILYLHPKEFSLFPLKSVYSIHTKFNDLFEIKKKGKSEQKFPKESITINLKVEVTSKRYKTYDNFFIEWDSLKQSPDWNAPRIKCYNKRLDKYIGKMEVKE